MTLKRVIIDREEKKTVRKLKEHRPADFFVFRTPLLPFDEFLAFGQGLEASNNLTDFKLFEAALRRDRLLLRDRLKQIFLRPEVREALWIATPDLYEMLDPWRKEPDTEDGLKMERSLYRYFARMTARATPFGLFAGCSIARIGTQTNLLIEGKETHIRHARPDMECIYAVANQVTLNPEARASLVVRPNPSLYSAGGRLHYAESVFDGKKRTHNLVAVEETPVIEATLARAANGAKAKDLARALVTSDSEISQAEAEGFIADLLQSQLLVSATAPVLTGREPFSLLVSELSSVSNMKAMNARLREVQDSLEKMNGQPLGIDPAQYKAMGEKLSLHAPSISMSHMIQVDLIKPAPQAVLGESVLAEIIRGVETLWTLSDASEKPSQDLADFCEAFALRYETRQIPLVIALDADLGVGFGAWKEGSPAGVSPLLQGVRFPPRPAEFRTARNAKDRILTRKLADALFERKDEITLDPQELESFSRSESLPIPDSFAVVASIAASSNEAIAKGEFQVGFQQAVFGPSGARMFGRFCHADKTLYDSVERYLRLEEALRPDLLFAEIVYLPEDRFGNFICRPLFRNYEIVYLGRSGAPRERQIPISDLMVSVEGGRARLRSKSLKKEIMPRLTASHNYYYKSNLPVYQFLCALQDQGNAVLGWHWGTVGSQVPFLPRVRVGKVVLSPVSWRLSREELKGLGKLKGGALFQEVWRLKTKYRMPRFVLLTEFDNKLPVDFENGLSVDALTHLISRRDSCVFEEMFPGPGQLCAEGKEGRFTHELIVPFIRKEESMPASDVSTKDSPGQGEIPRVFPPGSEWLFAKVYCDSLSVEKLLREEIRPLAKEALASGWTDQWFFLRYADPEVHLRLRFHGDPGKLASEVLPRLHERVAGLLQQGLIWKVQLDTYLREVERYGGPQGIFIAEEFFQIDSSAVLEILELLATGDEGDDARWRLAFCGIHFLLDDFGFDVRARRAILKTSYEYRAEKVVDDAKDWVGEAAKKFRKERSALEALLHPKTQRENPLWPGLQILQERSKALKPILQKLKEFEAKGNLTSSREILAGSYVHMHVNRLLRSAHLYQEPLLYYFLSQIYLSQGARQKNSS